MWRLPVLNLCLVLLVITILALRHSASVFNPGETRYLFTSDNPSLSPPRTAPEIILYGVGPVAGLRSAFGDLADFWQRSIILKEWLLECETTYWERMRGSGDAETGLAEARFHVANAEAFWAVMGDNQRAKIELDRADQYLSQTRPLVEPMLGPLVEKIRDEIGAAKASLDSNSSANPEPYEKIKSDLDHTIEKLHLT